MTYSPFGENTGGYSITLPPAIRCNVRSSSSSFVISIIFSVILLTPVAFVLASLTKQTIALTEQFYTILVLFISKEIFPLNIAVSLTIYLFRIEVMFDAVYIYEQKKCVFMTAARVFR